MNRPGQIEVKNLSEFQLWVESFSQSLKGDEILLLSGEMGAGKTEFAKTLAKAWGIEGVVSPTFALHATFQSKKGLIDHFDLYRIQDQDEIETTGLWEILQSPSLVIVEWPERVSSNAWPRGRVILRIQIVKTGSDSRRISWS